MLQNICWPEIRRLTREKKKKNKRKSRPAYLNQVKEKKNSEQDQSNFQGNRKRSEDEKQEIGEDSTGE